MHMQDLCISSYVNFSLATADKYRTVVNQMHAEYLGDRVPVSMIAVQGEKRGQLGVGNGDGRICPGASAVKWSL